MRGLAGYCYVACEAIYHLCGGKDSGLTPHVLRIPGGTHWFLRDAHSVVIDPTVEQFRIPPDYSKSRGCGFLTRQPSKRAAVVMALVNANVKNTCN